MKEIMVAVIMMFSIGLANAQPPNRQRPEGPPKMNVEQLQKNLDLSKEQVVKVKLLHEKMEMERKEKGQQKPSEQERKKHEEILRSEMAKILSKDQQKKYETLKRKQHPRPDMKNGQGGK